MLELISVLAVLVIVLGVVALVGHGIWMLLEAILARRRDAPKTRPFASSAGARHPWPSRAASCADGTFTARSPTSCATSRRSLASYGVGGGWAADAEDDREADCRDPSAIAKS